MNAPFLLRLAENRSILGHDKAPFNVPSLKGSASPENAYSVNESKRRVHNMIGEAILETLILVTLKRLNASESQISKAAECKTKIVRCLSKHGFKDWSTLTTETESILRFKRSRTKSKHHSTVPEPMGVLTPRFRPDLSVTRHRSGSVDMTMLFDSQANNQQNQNSQNKQVQEQDQIQDLAATNRHLVHENQRLSKEKQRLMEGLDRASEHILSAKKERKSAKKIKSRKQNEALSLSTNNTFNNTSPTTSATTTTTTTPTKNIAFPPNISTTSVATSTTLPFTTSLVPSVTSLVITEDAVVQTNISGNVIIIGEKEHEQSLENAQAKVELRLLEVEETSRLRLLAATSEMKEKRNEEIQELNIQLEATKENLKNQKLIVTDTTNALNKCKRQLSTTVDQVAEAKMTATRSLLEAEKRQEEALQLQESTFTKQLELAIHKTRESVNNKNKNTDSM